MKSLIKSNENSQATQREEGRKERQHNWHGFRLSFLEEEEVSEGSGGGVIDGWLNNNRVWEKCHVQRETKRRPSGNKNVTSVGYQWWVRNSNGLFVSYPLGNG